MFARLWGSGVLFSGVSRAVLLGVFWAPDSLATPQDERLSVRVLPRIYRLWVSAIRDIGVFSGIRLGSRGRQQAGVDWETLASF